MISGFPSAAGGTGGGLSESEVQALIDDALDAFTPPSGGGGGFSYGGDWNVVNDYSIQNAVFNQFDNATVSNGTITPTGSNANAYMRNILYSSYAHGVTKQFKFTYPTISAPNYFMIAFASSLNGENINLLSFDDMVGNPNTNIRAITYNPNLASAMGLSSNQASVVKDGASAPVVANPSVLADAGDEILLTVAGNEITAYNITKNAQMFMVYGASQLDAQVCICVQTTVPIEYSLAVAHPVQQTQLTANIPTDPIGKTYRIANGFEVDALGHNVILDDFVTFYEPAPGVLDFVTNRFVDKTKIVETIDEELQDEDSGLYARVQQLGNAGVVDAVNIELNTADSDMQLAIFGFLQAQLSYGQGDFYDAVKAVAISAINEELTSGGVIDNAIQNALNP